MKSFTLIIHFLIVNDDECSKANIVNHSNRRGSQFASLISICKVLCQTFSNHVYYLIQCRPFFWWLSPCIFIFFCVHRRYLLQMTLKIKIQATKITRFDICIRKYVIYLSNFFWLIKKNLRKMRYSNIKIVYLLKHFFD